MEYMVRAYFSSLLAGYPLEALIERITRLQEILRSSLITRAEGNLKENVYGDGL